MSEYEYIILFLFTLYFLAELCWWIYIGSEPLRRKVLTNLYLVALAFLSGLVGDILFKIYGERIFSLYTQYFVFATCIALQRILLMGWVVLGLGGCFLFAGPIYLRFYFSAERSQAKTQANSKIFDDCIRWSSMPYWAKMLILVVIIVWGLYTTYYTYLIELPKSSP